jgi:2-methylcitrate dehydratase PrpD
MADTATRLAKWADRLVPSEIELQMAGRALTDTVAVAMAGLAEPVAGLLDQAPEAERWATIAHVLDYDDLHIPSTSHISVVCVPATLVAGSSARAYLAGAGVMARVGRILGWPHYSAGWHATGTAGALGAAVCAGVGYGLDQAGLSRAIALAVPGAGGVQRAFGTMGKSLQVGFAAGAGVRAAQLARAGATADTSAVDQWLALLRGRPADPARVDGELTDPAAIPGGLAIKVFPCCYALQRPICALAQLGRLDPAAVQRIEVRTPAAAVQPLIHHQPDNGLQGKFSLEYGIAAALLDQRTGFASFTDEAVRRPSAQQLLRRVTAEHPGPAAEHPGTGPAAEHPGASPAAGLAGDDDLLAGTFEADVYLIDGSCRQVSLAAPLGSPSRPLTAGGLRDKVADCCGDRAADVLAADWQTALPLLRDAYQRRLSHDRQRSP